MTRSYSQLVNFVSKFLGTVRFRNDQIVKIMRYGDYQLGNVTISRVYYVEGLGHNLFSIGQFCDADLEFAFRKNTCFIWNLEGVDLLSGSRYTNLYTISLDDMLKTSPICLLSKASKTKSWLWHRRLSHLNFGTLNKLAKDGLGRGILKLKFKKDHLSKDEAPEAIIKYIKNIQVCLNATVRNVRTDNGTKFVNHTLREFYESVGITYPTNDSEDLGKLNAKADIGIFVGYAPVKKDFRIYNRRTHKIMETFHMTFDELTTMASEQFSSGPGLQPMTPATSSLGLVPNPVPQQLLVAAAPRVVDIAGSPSSTTIDQDAPSSSTSSNNQQAQSLIISQGVVEPIPNVLFDNPCHEPLYDVSNSQESSSNV
ncbi:integrase, catalytic region, zinc finger, CCHC-type containing protein [Tanacetum coccineum]|uniref:Integrase, catalytic region, zinc finger, CCHC-type containing protein n=1 Tax=Tanacetum coccineum TaxID=301880 RepID=A0ABQ4YWY2_9ASTR